MSGYMTEEEIAAEQALMMQQRVDDALQFDNAAEEAPLISEEDAHAVTPLDLLSSKNYTDRDARDARLSVCKSCDRLFKPTMSCRECGCFMALKTWLTDATCPLGKWQPLEES